MSSLTLGLRREAAGERVGVFFLISLLCKDKHPCLVFMCLKGQMVEVEFRFHMKEDHVFIKGRAVFHFTAEVNNLE